MKEVFEDFDFDFGFTAIDETELEAVQEAATAAASTSEAAEHIQAKLDKLFNSIQPLLNNLKKNPEKPILHWPNRLNDVEKFEDYIQKLYNS